MVRSLSVLKRVVSLFSTFIALRRIGSYKSKPKINFYCRFNRSTFLGENCHFNGFVVRGQGQVHIGDNFHSGKHCLIINSYHKYDDANAIPYDTIESIHKPVVIKDNVWIGDHVIILGGVTIGEAAIIQAGSVVSSDIPKYGIAGGNPAKVFKQRNINQYEKLKQEGLTC